MSQKQDKEQKRVQVPQLAVSKRFGKYKPEEKKEERKVSHTPGKVERLYEIYLKLFEGRLKQQDLQPELESLKPESKDLNGFAEFMANSEKGMYIHSFLSQAINLLSEPEFHINFPSIKLTEIEIKENVRATIHSEIRELNIRKNAKVKIVGYCGGLVAEENAKVELFGNCFEVKCQGADITVHGTAHKVGESMESGRIVIRMEPGSKKYEGNLGEKMRGGEIEVFGDCKDEIGKRMKGGKITIHGNAEGRLGYFMSGGDVNILGNYYLHIPISIGTQMRNGRITIHGNVIVIVASIAGSTKGQVEIKGRIRYRETR